MLYLLTLADAKATGPSACTPWRLALIRELVSKVSAAMQRSPAGGETIGAAPAKAIRVPQGAKVLDLMVTRSCQASWAHDHTFPASTCCNPSGNTRRLALPNVAPMTS